MEKGDPCVGWVPVMRGNPNPYFSSAVILLEWLYCLCAYLRTGIRGRPEAGTPPEELQQRHLHTPETSHCQTLNFPANVSCNFFFFLSSQTLKWWMVRTRKVCCLLLFGLLVVDRILPNTIFWAIFHIVNLSFAIRGRFRLRLHHPPHHS